MCQVEVVDHDSLCIHMVTSEVSCNMFATQHILCTTACIYKAHIIEEYENVVVVENMCTDMYKEPSFNVMLSRIEVQTTVYTNSIV